MYPHQAERVTRAIERGGVDALVATGAANVRYLTGFSRVSPSEGAQAAVYGVTGDGRTALVVPADDAVGLADEGTGADVVVAYGESLVEGGHSGEAAARLAAWIARPVSSALDGLAAAVEALGLHPRMIALDETALSPAAWREAHERLTGARVVPAAALLREARAVKGPYEIACLQRAVHLAEEALNEVVQILKPGVSEREAVRLYEGELVRRGAAPDHSLVVFGERTALPAAPPSDRRLRSGDLIRFELGGIVDGYRSDLARTAVMGEPSARQTRAHAAVLAGEQAALHVTRPGTRARDLVAAATEATRAAGLERYRPQPVGGGIGLEAREAPRLDSASEATLEAGMVLRLAIRYWELGWGGVAVQDTVLVTLNGGRSLNRSARGLLVLD